MLCGHVEPFNSFCVFVEFLSFRFFSLKIEVITCSHGAKTGDQMQSFNPLGTPLWVSLREAGVTRVPVVAS